MRDIKQGTRCECIKKETKNVIILYIVNYNGYGEDEWECGGRKTFIIPKKEGSDFAYVIEGSLFNLNNPDSLYDHMEVSKFDFERKESETLIEAAEKFMVSHMI
jgi:hypothetical protein